MAFPTTDPGLLRQLKDPAETSAWDRFVAIYRPAIVAVARQRGLAFADADDVAQEVFTAVAGAVHRFDPDREDGVSSGPRARFSTWLATIAERKTIDALRRSRVRPASGHAFDAVAARDTDSRLLRFELRRRLFLADVRKIVPGLRLEDLRFAEGFGGVRPQLIDKRARRLMLGEVSIPAVAGLVFHVTPSPGGTCCLGIAEQDAAAIADRLGCRFDRQRLEQELHELPAAPPSAP